MKWNKHVDAMDEMEKDIYLKSIRCAFNFTTLALVAWVITGWVTKSNFRLPTYILAVQYLVHYVATQLFRKQVADESWKKNISSLIITTIIVLLVMLAIPLAVMVR